MSDSFSKEEVFIFLDDLRESGETNMYGALPYILDNFPGIKREQARKLLVDWMEQFGDSDPNKPGEEE